MTLKLSLRALAAYFVGNAAIVIPFSEGSGSFFPNIFGNKRLRIYTFSGAVAGGNRMSKVRI